jgi:hypothetical protein
MTHKKNANIHYTFTILFSVGRIRAVIKSRSRAVSVIYPGNYLEFDFYIIKVFVTFRGLWRWPQLFFSIRCEGRKKNFMV